MSESVPPPTTAPPPPEPRAPGGSGRRRTASGPGRIVAGAGRLALVAVIAFAAGASIARLASRRSVADAWRDEILRAAERADVNEHLLAALVDSGNAGRAGDGLRRGLLGLTDALAREGASALGEPPPSAEALDDPETNLRLGAAALRSLGKRFDDDPFLTLAAFLDDPGRIERAARAHAEESGEAIAFLVLPPERVRVLREVLARWREREFAGGRTKGPGAW